MLSRSGSGAGWIREFMERAEKLVAEERGELVGTEEVLFEANEKAARMGGSRVIGKWEGSRNHFVAFVKGRDGGLWEMEGVSRGPIRRGSLEDGEDVVSERAFEMGLRRWLRYRGGLGRTKWDFLVLRLPAM